MSKTSGPNRARDQRRNNFNHGTLEECKKLKEAIIRELNQANGRPIIYDSEEIIDMLKGGVQSPDRVFLRVNNPGIFDTTIEEIAVIRWAIKQLAEERWVEEAFRRTED